MTEGFQTVLSASEKDRHDLFVGASNRLGTAEQNIEKDFWVCWTLDALFNGLEGRWPAPALQGGHLALQRRRVRVRAPLTLPNIPNKMNGLKVPSENGRFAFLDLVALLPAFCSE
jgi:hypothetical protein